MAEALENVFDALRKRMLQSRGTMVKDRDQPGDLQLVTPWIEPGKAKPAWFGAVQCKKNYVSVHLMPLYCLPAMRDELPPELLKRMQGKSCFNFKAVDPTLFDVLEGAIAKCADAYADAAVLAKR